MIILSSDLYYLECLNMSDTEPLLVSKKDKTQFFREQWKTFSDDQRLGSGHWTNMRMVGVEADGTFNSVKVKIIMKINYN